MSAPNRLNVAPNNEVLTVSNNLLSFPLTLPATIPGGSTAILNELSPTLYPTVGESYLVNLNPVFSADFNSAPTSGTLGVLLVYANSLYTVSYVQASSYKVIATGTAGSTFGFNTSLSLTFTHTDPTNRIYVIIDNLTSNSIVGASSVFNVDCGIISLGARTNTITAADFI